MLWLLETGCCRSGFASDCRRKLKPAAQSSLGRSAALVSQACCRSAWTAWSAILWAGGNQTSRWAAWRSASIAFSTSWRRSMSSDRTGFNECGRVRP